MDDYEIIPVEEVEKLKEEVEKLKVEQKNTPIFGIASSLEHLASSLDKLFKIFDVAAVDIEKEKLEEKSFEEKIRPIMERLRDIEIQQKDLADGVLSLVDIVKNKKKVSSSLPSSLNGSPQINMPPVSQDSVRSPPFQNMGVPSINPPVADSGLPPFPNSIPKLDEDLDLPPPPKKGFLGKFK